MEILKQIKKQAMAKIGMPVLDRKDFLKETKVKYKGKERKIRIYYYPMLEYSGMLFAAALPGNIILVDNRYMKANASRHTDVCAGIIAHETGHIVCGHMSVFNTLKRVIYATYLLKIKKLSAPEAHAQMREKMLALEYEADDYAYSQDKWNTLAMLAYAYGTAAEEGYDTEEITARYKRLGGISKAEVDSMIHAGKIIPIINK